MGHCWVHSDAYRPGRKQLCFGCDCSQRDQDIILIYQFEPRSERNDMASTRPEVPAYLGKYLKPSVESRWLLTSMFPGHVSKYRPYFLYRERF